MKSFGVRLAAGAITILFGAYAAAVAQKDKQNSTEAWTAGPPSLGEPAAPISAMEDETWLSQPSTEEQPEQEFGALQLVQHTEEVPTQSAPSMDLSSLPAGLGEPTATDSAADPVATVPDWTLDVAPQTEAPAPSANTAALPSNTPMGFPGELSAVLEDVSEPAPMNLPESAAPADLNAGVPSTTPNPIMQQLPESVEQLQTENAPDPQNFLRDQNQTANTLRGGEVPQQPIAQNQALEPQVPIVAEPNPAQNRSLPFAGMPEPEPTQPAPLSYGQPDPNAFREAPPTMAQNDPSFSRSMQQFNQPAYNDQPVAQLPNSNQFAAPPLNNAQFNQQTERMASLGGNSGLQPQSYNQPVAAPVTNDEATTNSPGDRRLEGAQSPSIVIHKQAPQEVKVGKPASFAIRVQNVGSVEALDVKVHDSVPLGMRLVDASPAPLVKGNQLLWQLGAMPAGDERTLTMQLVPEQEGELGSVARVSFEAAASVRTMSTRPELRITQSAPKTVLIGQQLEIQLEVSNPGTGEATNVVLLEDVPAGLEHPKGPKLDSKIGNLAPGEIRQQVLRLRATEPGMIRNVIHLAADDGLQAKHSVDVQVIAPDLQVDLVGPSRRFLERQATYQLAIANAGTADANNVVLNVQLDRGFTFVSTEKQGAYDPSSHTVTWALDRLPAGANGTIDLTLLPVEEGEQAIRMNARADLGVVAKNERKMMVEGFSELSFSITNPGGPIELGAETTYEIRVNNSGSKADSNVQVQLRLPTGLKLISTDGDAGTDGRGLVAFQPKPQLTPGSDFAYTIRVQGIAPGNYIVQAIVSSDQNPKPVTKEESTLVYADR